MGSEPTEPVRDLKPNVHEGVPWQIIYASFLGVTLCAFGIYGGMALLNADLGWAGALGGVTGIIVAIGVATAYVALMTAVSWSIIVCRITMPLFAAGALAAFVWAVVHVVRSVSWRLSAASIVRQLIDVAFSPHFLVPLAALGICAAMVYFLFGDASRRFFDR